MSKDQVKFYKNPHRKTAGEGVERYVPQYQERGIEPVQHKGGTASAIAVPSVNNPRARHIAVQQPYGQRSASPLGTGPMLNVGNNAEHNWSVGVDAQVIDDLEDETQIVDPHHPMVDNNELVTNSALGLPEELPTLDEVTNPPRKRFTQEQVAAAFNKGFRQPVVVQEPELDLVSALHELEEGTYLLMVSGVLICSGPLEDVQEQARALIFGEHEMCEGNPVSVDDIVVLRRAKIKVGLFLE